MSAARTLHQNIRDRARSNRGSSNSTVSVDGADSPWRYPFVCLRWATARLRGALRRRLRPGVLCC